MRGWLVAAVFVAAMFAAIALLGYVSGSSCSEGEDCPACTYTDNLDCY